MSETCKCGACWQCKLPAKQAELDELSRFFGEPVMPLPKFCEALRTWMRCIEEANSKGEQYAHGSEYAKVLGRIDLDISKSNLLWRLLYAGEPLRTRPCPEHKGRWSGIRPCPHGCGETGWVPNDWPENAEPCTHCGKPAVATTYSVASGREHLCWDHYKSWPRTPPTNAAVETPAPARAAPGEENERP